LLLLLLLLVVLLQQHAQCIEGRQLQLHHRRCHWYAGGITSVNVWPQLRHAHQYRQQLNCQREWIFALLAHLLTGHSAVTACGVPPAAATAAAAAVPGSYCCQALRCVCQHFWQVLQESCLLQLLQGCSS
jgi:hypothetical protein